MACGSPEPEHRDTGDDSQGTGDTAADASGDLPVYPSIPLADLLDLESLRDRESLRVIIEPQRSGQVPGDFDDPVWQIGFTFTSQRFLGNEWVHQGFLLVPQELPADGRAAAIVEYGTDNGITGISDSVSFLPQFGAQTADRLNMPILLLADVPPPTDLRLDSTLEPFRPQVPQCFSGTIGTASLFEECLRVLSRESGRLDIHPLLPIAIAYVRAVTLIEDLAQRLPTLDLDFELPAFQVDHVAILAGDIDGVALRYAMALDHRIQGIMVAANLGQWRPFYELQASEWSEGFSYGIPSQELTFLDSPAGAEFLEAYDLTSLGETLADRSYLVAMGTNSTRYPHTALDGYQHLLPQDSATLFVANYADGFGSADHLRAWRLFLAHLFRSRDFARVEATSEDDGGNIRVTAEVSGSTMLGSAELWYVQRHSTRDDADYRDAIWRSTPMLDSGGSLTAQFTPLTEYSAFFVRVVDSQSIYEGPITSPIYLTTP